MIGNDFSFLGKSLSDFNLVMANPEKEESSGLNREVLKGAVTANKYEAIHFGSKYSDVLPLPLFVIKDKCKDSSPKITQAELRAINKWLTGSRTPQALTMSFDTSTPIEYYGIFTEITPYVVDGLNGLYLTFTCTSPFAFEVNSLKFQNTQSNYQKVFNCTSDENTYVYPIVKIEPSANGTFTICNQNENKTMSVTLQSGKTYIFDCKLKRVTIDGVSASMSDIDWDITDIIDYNGVATGTVNLYWLRFVPGENTLVVNGSGNFEFSCKSPVKVGGYPYD